MTNAVTSTGLTIDSLNEIITKWKDGMRAIYGADINVESNSPDGQFINLAAQIERDLLEVVQSVYDSFDPDQATGIVLNSRVAINNIERRGATYTLQDIDITVDRALSLQGLDAAADDPNGTGFTVSDTTGNQFILLDSQSPSSAGTYTYTFRAKNLGAIETTPNTIIQQVTIVLGVTTVNNPDGALEVGQNEETDQQLRLRRARSVANASNGYLNGLLGAVLNLDGVTDGAIYENVTNTTDSNGIPGHSIWLIVEGGANSAIANLIYSKKSYGAGMKGAVEVEITTPSNQIFTAKFDRPESETLYIRFDIRPLKSGQTFDTDAIKNYIVENLSYGISEDAIASTISLIAQAGIVNDAGIGSGAVENLEISDDDTIWTYFLETSALNKKWSVSAINIQITIL